MAVKILIPYNFSVNDEKAIDFVEQQYGDEPETDITLFHAFTPIPEIDMKNDPIMAKMHQNLLYLRQRREELKKNLENVKEKLGSFGFKIGNIHCLFQALRTDIAEEIIALWQKENFDVVVLSRNPGNIINYFTKSVSNRITSFKNGIISVHIIN